MNIPQIKTHNMNNEYLNQNYFFILSKGDNAGKPLHEPCPNCFVIISQNLIEKEYYYWLCYGLWVGGFFKPLLSGSVISFLRISEFKNLLIEKSSIIELRKNALMDSVLMLNKLSSHQKNLIKQIHLINQAMQALMHKVLK